MALDVPRQHSVRYGLICILWLSIIMLEVAVMSFEDYRDYSDFGFHVGAAA